MIAETQAFITSINAATSIIKGFISLDKDIAVKEKSTELLSHITTLQTEMLSLQSNYQELINDKVKLEKKMIRIEDWKKISSDYELKQVVTGFFVYVQKKLNPEDREYHWLCPNCFEDKIKSILQHKSWKGTARRMYCPKCNYEVLVYKGNVTKPFYSKER